MLKFAMRVVLEKIVGRVFNDVHPNRIRELMLLQTTQVMNSQKEEPSDDQA